MFRTRWTTVLACLIAPAVVTWVVSDLSLRHHGWVPSLTPWGAVVALVISVIVFIAGLAVRRLRAHEPTWITPTGAATTAVAAQASAIVGALVGGVYAGEIATALLALARHVLAGVVRGRLPGVVRPVVRRRSARGALVRHRHG